MPLTAIAIRHAKPSAKTRKMFDGGGLYLELTPRGGKWWRLKYRFGGKEKVRVQRGYEVIAHAVDARTTARSRSKRRWTTS